MGVVAFFSMKIVSQDILKLILGIFTGGLYFTISSYFISRDEFNDIKSIIKK